MLSAEPSAAGLPHARGWLVAVPFVAYFAVAGGALGAIGASRYGGDDHTRFYHPLFGLGALATYGILLAGVLLIASRFGPPLVVLRVRRTALWPAVGLVVVSFVGIAIASVLVLEPVFHGTDAQDVTPAAWPGTAPAAVGVVLVTVTFVVAAPVVEELYFRGLVMPALGGLGDGRRAALGIVASGLVFGAIHLVPAAIPALSLLGCVLALLVRRTGSIWPAIALHALNNAIATALAFGQAWT